MLADYSTLRISVQISLVCVYIIDFQKWFLWKSAGKFQNTLGKFVRKVFKKPLLAFFGDIFFWNAHDSSTDYFRNSSRTFMGIPPGTLLVFPKVFLLRSPSGIIPRIYFGNSSVFSPEHASRMSSGIHLVVFSANPLCIRTGIYRGSFFKISSEYSSISNF